MAYRVEIDQGARRQLKKIPAQMLKQIGTAIDGLAVDPRPHGSSKLKGSDFYRIRVGDYRIIYEVQDKRLIVLVVAVGNRRDIYRKP